MAPRSAAGQIWPHLPTGTPEPVKQRQNSLGDAMWPSLSREQKAKEALTAKWQAEQKARSKRMAEHLREINERL